jgi:hypothetical protein
MGPKTPSIQEHGLAITRLLICFEQRAKYVSAMVALALPRPPILVAPSLEMAIRAKSRPLGVIERHLNNCTRRVAVELL